MRKNRAGDSYSTTSGYLILSGLSVIMFALALQDPMFLVFGIPILMLFVLGASIDSGDPGRDLEAVGFSGKNLALAIPLGIAGGLLALFIGGMLTRNSTASLAAIVPDFSAAGILVSASIVPPAISNAINIFVQWSVIAPSEESLARVLAPYAGRAIFKNWLIGFIFGSGLWIATHIPTFLTNSVGNSMYTVLAVLSIITVSLLLLTRTLVSSIVAHSTFNTGVILMGQGLDRTAIFVIALIGLILMLAMFTSTKGGNKHAKAF